MPTHSPHLTDVTTISRRSIYVKLVCVAMFWGGTFIAGRLLANHIDPALAALGRFFVAAVLLLIITLKKEGRLPKLTASQWLLTAAMGATGIALYNILFFNALTHIEAGRTALFVSFSPVITAIVASLIYQEKLSSINWLGIIIAFIGVITIVSRGNIPYLISHFSQSVGIGEISMACAVMGWIAYTLLGRKILSTLSPLAATTYAALWGFLFLLLYTLTDIQHHLHSEISLSVITAILYLSVLGTVVGFVWYYEGIQQLGAAKTVIFNNLVPLFAVIFSALFLNEKITLSMIIGGLLVVFGVRLTNKK